MNHLPLFKLLFIGLARTLPCRGQPGTMTYQGTLTQNNAPATGNHDFEFRLFDQPSGGTQQGTTLTVSSVVVNNGQFTTAMDFGYVLQQSGNMSAWSNSTFPVSDDGTFRFVNFIPPGGRQFFRLLRQ